MKHNSHHGHFEAPREKRRLTGKQKGIIGIVLALAVLAGVATGIYKTLVKPPEKPQPVQEETQDANTQPEPGGQEADDQTRRDKGRRADGRGSGGRNRASCQPPDRCLQHF